MFKANRLHLENDHHLHHLYGPQDAVRGLYHVQSLHLFRLPLLSSSAKMPVLPYVVLHSSVGLLPYLFHPGPIEADHCLSDLHERRQ